MSSSRRKDSIARLFVDTSNKASDIKKTDHADKPRNKHHPLKIVELAVVDGFPLDSQRTLSAHDACDDFSLPPTLSLYDPSNDETDNDAFPTSLKPIDMTDCKFIKKIGSGSSADVFRATWQNKDIAVKKMDFSCIQFKREAAFLHKLTELNAPNIVQFIGYSTDNLNYFYLGMEYVPGGSLDCLLDSARELSWSLRISFMLDIARAIDFLHQMKILHRDVKSPNIFLRANFQLVLGDFGSAIYFDQKQSFAGTIAWMAPELFAQKPATPASDIFSVAVTFWEIASRQVPYEAHKEQSMIKIVSEGHRENIPLTCPKDIADLITESWDQDPTKRPTAGKLLARLSMLAEKSKINVSPIDVPEKEKSAKRNTDQKRFRSF